MSIALTIGMYDGVHLGHQALIHRCLELGRCLCLTFPEHPSNALGRPSPPLLCRPEHKEQLLRAAGVDQVIMMPFDANLANLEAEEFLHALREKYGFDHLILGHDARLGRARAGTPERLHNLFPVEYLDPVNLDGKIVSSSRVRSAVAAGDLKNVEALLGRPLSYYGPIIHGEGKGRQIGFPTANLDISGLCVPPYGVYAVTMDGQPGVANLGVAPTIQEHRKPTLEVHLFSDPGDLYGQDVEIILHRFLRPEKRFASVDALRAQIVQDIAASQ